MIRVTGFHFEKKPRKNGKKGCAVDYNLPCRLWNGSISILSESKDADVCFHRNTRNFFFRLKNIYLRWWNESKNCLYNLKVEIIFFSVNTAIVSLERHRMYLFVFIVLILFELNFWLNWRFCLLLLAVGWHGNIIWTNRYYKSKTIIINKKKEFKMFHWLFLYSTFLSIFCIFTMTSLLISVKNFIPMNFCLLTISINHDFSVIGNVLFNVKC